MPEDHAGARQQMPGEPISKGDRPRELEACGGARLW